MLLSTFDHKIFDLLNTSFSKAIACRIVRGRNLMSDIQGMKEIAKFTAGELWTTIGADGIREAKLP